MAIYSRHETGTRKSRQRYVNDRDQNEKFDQSPLYGDEGGGGKFNPDQIEESRRSSDKYPHDARDEDESFYETFTEKQHERGPFNQGNRFLTPEQPHPSHRK